MCWMGASLPSSPLASSCPGVLVFPWEKGIPGWQQHENKTAYSLAKTKIQNPNCQQRCLAGGQSCNRLGCSMLGRNAACTGLCPARMAVVPIYKSTLPTHPLWIRPRHFRDSQSHWSY